MPVRLDTADPAFEVAFSAFLLTKRETAEDVDQDVARIIGDVRERGDEAVFGFAEKFDGQRLTPDTIRVPVEEIALAAATVPDTVRDALETAARRIEDYHRRQTVEDLRVEDSNGVIVGHRWTPIESVGLYVPGGLAAYPSTVLMTAIPAQVAGVSRVVMAVSTPDRDLNALVAAAAEIAGVTEVYRIGGAHAIAALALGTSSVRPVDKIVGPGNAYVTAAKCQMFGSVGIDMIAGPSEILVVADSDNDPAWIAADLLSQAEHDESAQAILMTDDAGFAASVETAVSEHLTRLERSDVAGVAWREFGAIIRLGGMDEAAALIDRIAPEHLELAVAEPELLANAVRNAGAIFLGRYTPEAVGDYVAGPSHVLPTARTARFSSGLSVLDFMKRTSLVQCDAESLRAVGPTAIVLAEAEGFGAHALSLKIRLDDDGQFET